MPNNIDLSHIVKFIEATDPIAVEYLKEMDRETGDFHVKTPLFALAEKRITALLMTVGGYFKVLDINGKPLGDSFSSNYPSMQKYFDAMAATVWQAPVIYLSEGMGTPLEIMMNKVQEALHEAGSNKPQLKKFPFNTAYITRYGTWNFVMAKDLSDVNSADSLELKFDSILALLDTDYPVILGINNYSSERGGTCTLLNLSEGFEGVRWLLDGLALFMESRLTKNQIVRPNRQMIKVLKRSLDKKMVGNLDVNVIELRRPENVKNESDKGDVKGRKYDSYQWLVSGHVRNQYYSMSNKHELIWIDPFVKGLEGKPFKEAVRHIRS